MPKEFHFNLNEQELHRIIQTHCANSCGMPADSICTAETKFKTFSDGTLTCEAFINFEDVLERAMLPQHEEPE